LAVGDARCSKVRPAMSQVHPEPGGEGAPPVAVPVAAPAGLEVPGQAYMGVVPGKQYTPVSGSLSCRDSLSCMCIVARDVI
jgi:hypothetical protein